MDRQYHTEYLSLDSIFDDPKKWDHLIFDDLAEQIGLPWNGNAISQLADYAPRTSLCRLLHGLSEIPDQSEGSTQ